MTTCDGWLAKNHMIVSQTSCGDGSGACQRARGVISPCRCKVVIYTRATDDFSGNILRFRGHANMIAGLTAAAHSNKHFFGVSSRSLLTDTLGHPAQYSALPAVGCSLIDLLGSCVSENIISTGGKKAPIPVAHGTLRGNYCQRWKEY